MSSANINTTGGENNTEFEQLMSAINSLGKAVVTTQLDQSAITRKFDELHSSWRSNPSTSHTNTLSDHNCTTTPYNRAQPHNRSQPSSCWRPGPRSQAATTGADHLPRPRMDLLRFDGSDPCGWIFRVQTYFDFSATADTERLQFVITLFDSPTSDWIRYYCTNNDNASWSEFLDAVRQRFDLDYYENYVGLLSKLQQIGTVSEYQSEFEVLMDKIHGVPDFVLIDIFVAGLKQPVHREVNLRKPSTLTSAVALARELSACHKDTLAAASWQRRP